MIDSWSWWKSTFFLFNCGRFFFVFFFGDFFLQIHQWCYIILAIDDFSFLKIINEQNTLHIPKYGGQNLACILMFVSLIALDSFHLLPSTQLTADLTPEWSDGSMFYPLSHIYAKTPFCCIETVTNNALNRRHVVFDQLWANTTPTLNTSFSLTNVHAKWRLHCLLISWTPLLSYATSIYNRPKWVCGVFWCFLGQLPNLSNLSIQHYLCPYDRI